MVQRGHNFFLIPNPIEKMNTEIKTLEEEIEPKELPLLNNIEDVNFDIIVFSHLRWGFVYQRPQHIISRLSDDYNILFVEEPIGRNQDQDFLYELETVSASLTVLKPKVNSISEIPEVLNQFLKSKQVNIGWFYSAAFSNLITEYSFNKVVYDCMDELSLFKFAPPELVEQEKFLLANADVVFTGGKALYESKKDLHSNVYCFPSSVDQQHFEKVFDEIEIPDDIKHITAPIVGYFGVIDERIDLDLLIHTALKLPEVSFVMIGPLAKIEDRDLPRAKNIHYLGMKDYAVLPNYLKAFDIAMMPFALNDATKHISPTKTLEYMAAKKPIISTPIKDVVREYGDCIEIVSSSDEFCISVEKIQKQSNRTITAYDIILENTSWTSTVGKMNDILNQL
ncbi:Glycosyltransferase involved in cell wall bisynthesis [Flavobacteriaceae bacterium MAR_2010_188]|nr:Glycosyltransferase involved in cell wall bisynthesis [Flavobacteriaceae bacterium MAR_2010_188]